MKQRNATSRSIIMSRHCTHYRQSTGHRGNGNVMGMPWEFGKNYTKSRWVFTARLRLQPQFGTPPVPNAPSLRICGQDPRNNADATFLDPHIVNCRSFRTRSIPNLWTCPMSSFWAYSFVARLSYLAANGVVYGRCGTVTPLQRIEMRRLRERVIVGGQWELQWQSELQSEWESQWEWPSK